MGKGEVALGPHWACKSVVPCSRQIITPAPHHPIYSGRMLCLMPNQQSQRTEGLWRGTSYNALQHMGPQAKSAILTVC